MNTDKLLYWRRALEVAASLASLLIWCFWPSAPPALAPGLQTFALALGQSPVGNRTTMLSRPPPPMPDPPRVDTIPAPPPVHTPDEEITK